MAGIVTIATDQTAALHVKHKAHHPEFDKAYWTAQHTADNDLYGQYNASDVGIIAVGSTLFPVRTGGTRHIRIIYDKVTKNDNRTDTTGSTLGSPSYWTIWMSIVYHYSVYQSTDPAALNAYCARFPNSLQPVLAYLEPSNRPHPAPGGGGSGGSGGSGGHPLPHQPFMKMLDFPRGDGPSASSSPQSLKEWVAKTEQMETILGLSDDSTEGGVTQKEKLAGAESSNQY